MHEYRITQDQIIAIQTRLDMLTRAGIPLSAVYPLRMIVDILKATQMREIPRSVLNLLDKDQPENDVDTANGEQPCS